MVNSLMDSDITLDTMFFPATTGEKIYLNSELKSNQVSPKY
jgi:hypothetical protein